MCQETWEPIGDAIDRVISQASAGGFVARPSTASIAEHRRRQALERWFHSTDDAYQRRAQFFTCAAIVVCGRWVHSIASDARDGAVNAARLSPSRGIPEMVAAVAWDGGWSNGRRAPWDRRILVLVIIGREALHHVAFRLDIIRLEQSGSRTLEGFPIEMDKDRARLTAPGKWVSREEKQTPEITSVESTEGPSRASNGKPLANITEESAAARIRPNGRISDSRDSLG